LPVLPLLPLLPPLGAAQPANTITRVAKEVLINKFFIVLYHRTRIIFARVIGLKVMGWQVKDLPWLFAMK
jgi:hypothetical protein